MMEKYDQIRGAIMGAAFADSYSVPSATHHVAKLPPRRSVRMRDLTEYADLQKQTTRPFPYTHAQPSNDLLPRPSDDCEWLYFTTSNFLAKKNPHLAWTELAQSRDNIRARNGTKIALRNLAEGKRPPVSGHDNPHYFDDIAMIRILGIAINLHQDVVTLKKVVTQEVETTHSEDGIYCANAFAQLVASILDFDPIDKSIQAALAELPSESWSRRVVMSALHLTESDTDILSRVVTLEREVVENIYAYPVSAPETLALALSHLHHAQTPHELLLASHLHRRNQDSLPALMGALAGLRFGCDWLPTNFLTQPHTLYGVCIPDLAGKDLDDLVDQLSHY